MQLNELVNSKLMSYRHPSRVNTTNRNAKLSTTTAQICSNCKAECQGPPKGALLKANHILYLLLYLFSIYFSTSTPTIHVTPYVLFFRHPPKGNQIKTKYLLLKDADNVHFGQLEVPSSKCSDILSLQ